MPQASYRSRLRTLVRMAKHQDWDVTLTSNGHWSFTSPQGEVTTAGTSPSDFRGVRNLEAKLRSMGLDTSTDRKGRRKRPYQAPADPMLAYIPPLQTKEPEVATPEKPPVEVPPEEQEPDEETPSADVDEFDEVVDENEFKEIHVSRPHRRMTIKEARELRFQAVCKQNPNRWYVLETDAHSAFVSYRLDARRDMWGDEAWKWDVRPVRGKPGRIRVAASWQPK